MTVFVIWEYQQRMGHDREEPLNPFYATEAAAKQALASMGTNLSDGYREIRQHEVVS